MRRTKVPARAGDEGTVLLSTLLVMSLMSAVTLALLITLNSAVRKTGTHNALSQLTLYSDGAKDFTQAQIAQFGNILPNQMMDIERAGPIVLPFENGSIRIQLTDGSHCLRLSGLVTENGDANESNVRRFQALLDHLGLDTGQAVRLSDRIVDWMDRDENRRSKGAEDGPYLSRNTPHRTANTVMQSISELRAIDSMTEALYQRLRPHVCLGETGASGGFNINMAGPENLPVLAALLGAEPAALTVAERLISERPGGGYTATSYDNSPAFEGIDLPDRPQSGSDLIVFEPQRLLAEVIVQYGPLERVRVFAFEGLDGSPRLTYEDWGWASLQPDSLFLAERVISEDEETRRP